MPGGVGRGFESRPAQSRYGPIPGNNTVTQIVWREAIKAIAAYPATREEMQTASNTSASVPQSLHQGRDEPYLMESHRALGNISHPETKRLSKGAAKSGCPGRGLDTSFVEGINLNPSDFSFPRLLHLQCLIPLPPNLYNSMMSLGNQQLLEQFDTS